MTLNDLLKPIAEDMRAVDQVILDRLTSEVALINEIGRHIVAAGGKRLRPALVLLAARALGCQTALPPLLAAMVEFIHTSTLLHDDVVDHSELRRGRKTANAVWGNSGAVLSGDFLYSRAFQMMVDSDRMGVMRVMADATNAIAEGEVLQLLNAGDPNVDEARYLRVIELKTAELFEAACRCGAISADASDAQQEAVAAYGRELGIAFQLVDDILDYTANPEETGKAVGNDLAEGKPTLPLIHAMRTGNADEAKLIREAISVGDAASLPAVLQAVARTGAIPYTSALAEARCALAIAALSAIPDSPYKQCMIDLARYSTSRAA